MCVSVAFDCRGGAPLAPRQWALSCSFTAPADLGSGASPPLPPPAAAPCHTPRNLTDSSATPAHTLHRRNNRQARGAGQEALQEPRPGGADRQLPAGAVHVAGGAAVRVGEVRPVCMHGGCMVLVAWLVACWLALWLHGGCLAGCMLVGVAVACYGLHGAGSHGAGLCSNAQWVEAPKSRDRDKH